MSEDITPRQPDDTTRLLGLILDRLNAIDARFDLMDKRLTAIEGSRDTVGKLDKLEASDAREDLKDIKADVHRIDRKLTRMGIDLAETIGRVDEIEDQSKDAS